MGELLTIDKHWGRRGVRSSRRLTSMAKATPDSSPAWSDLQFKLMPCSPIASMVQTGTGPCLPVWVDWFVPSAFPKGTFFIIQSTTDSSLEENLGLWSISIKVRLSLLGWYSSIQIKVSWPISQINYQKLVSKAKVTGVQKAISWVKLTQDGIGKMWLAVPLMMVRKVDRLEALPVKQEEGARPKRED